MASKKKELILIAGILLVMIGLLGTGLPLIYSVIISVGIYVAVKAFVGRRQQSITNEMPEGICADCGSKIVAGLCPNCRDAATEEK